MYDASPAVASLVGVRRRDGDHVAVEQHVDTTQGRQDADELGASERAYCDERDVEQPLYLVGEAAEASVA